MMYNGAKACRAIAVTLRPTVIHLKGWVVEIQIMLLVSTGLQFAAAVLALRLAWRYRQQRAWVLISIAIALMVLQRLFSLSYALDDSPLDMYFWVAEIVGLALSAFFLWGIGSIGPLLRALQQTHDDLEQHVATRTFDLSRANAALQAEITERENVADALRASEARYRAVVNDQTDLICRYRPDGTLTFANDAYCVFYGKPLNELIGLSIYQNMPEDDIDRVKRIVARLDADNPVSVTEHHTLTTGHESWRQWTRRAILDEQGQIVEIQATARDVTRQHLMEDAMREREADLRRMVQNLPVMVDAMDENAVFVMWNRECERVTGYTAEEMVGNPEGMALIYPNPAYRDEMRTVFHQLGGDFRDWELTLLAKDGSERVVAWSNVARYFPIPGWHTWGIGVDITRRKHIETALHDAHEALERRVTERTTALRAANEALRREITERQRADLALRASQSMLRMTIDALADLVHVIDRDMRIILYNEPFQTMILDLGIETRAIGRTPFELFAFLPDKVRAEYQQVFDSGQILITQDETKLGTLTIYAETRKIPVFDGDQVTHVVTVIRDTTEPQRTEKALRDSEERYNLAATAGQVGVWDWDLATGALYVDPQLKRLLGYEDHEIENRVTGWDHIRHPDDNARVEAAIQAHFEQHTPYYETERRFIHKDGSVRWFLSRGSALYDEQGKVYRVVGTDTDITARKLAEQELLQLTLAQERSAILAQFIQDTSHEFANPLSVIKNSIYLALNVPDTLKRQRHLDIVRGQIFHIEKLVEGLLTMSRLDSGFPFRCEPVPMDRLLRTVCETLSAASQAKQQTVLTEWGADLPAVLGDVKHLNLAFRQIIDNAIRYTPAGGTITIHATPQGEQVVIEVRDTGIGIAADHLGHIFERFFRVEKARTERGVGLGLPIARTIIERHAGRIEVESTPGAGSTCRVFLPISGC